ncbi:MAG: hypothetical protein ACYTAF_16740 [Planctomycetota bacterium]
MRIEPVHPDFVVPFKGKDIRATLGSIPRKFTEGLKAVFVPQASKKQQKTRGRLLLYGSYFSNCVALFPYPKSDMRMFFRRKPKESWLRDWKRAGARTAKKDSGIEVSFDEESLKTFFLRDVLIHEIGHHIDNRYGKRSKEQEGFADWFSSEYGFRLWK